MRVAEAKPVRIPLAAIAVHAYTASGAILAFVGIRAVFEGRVRLAFATMVAATVVDSTDGVLARLARVKAVLPSVDGARIDDIVDYLTFVVLPMLLLDRFGFLPPRYALVIVAVVLLSSLYGFTSADAKTADHFFTGFPSYWNIVALYLYVLDASPLASAVVLLILSALVFVRIGYVYPSRTPVLRRFTVTFGALWAVMVAAIIWRLPTPPRWLWIASLAFPVYYVVLSLVLDARRRPALPR
ncbi:MAG: CDP-diacylglycerol O-phosphatidyltransferase [Acidobacteria bacterium]|nr:CDP-diacylglycerol O-phosphatidyltransferase [Acidobacteriota bacterium]